MLKKLIDDLNAVEDPAERIRLATEALEAVTEFNAEVADIRQTSARELREQGLSLAKIGQLAKPDKPLHRTRIDQILKGGPTGRWAKAAKESAPKGEP